MAGAPERRAARATIEYLGTRGKARLHLLPDSIDRARVALDAFLPGARPTEKRKMAAKTAKTPPDDREASSFRAGAGRLGSTASRRPRPRGRGAGTPAPVLFIAHGPNGVSSAVGRSAP
jgi:hypothetical protein